jgi:CRISPR system Cascade subunit CasB
MQTELTNNSEPSPFFQRLYKIARDKDRANLSSLRKSLGRAEGAQLLAYPVIGSFLPSKQRAWDEAKFILIAGLFASHIDLENPKLSFKGDFGASFKNFQKACAAESPGAYDGIDKRFSHLLESEAEDLPIRLRHAVSLLKSKSIDIDWPQLLKDLIGWGNPDRYVQKQWARSYWTPSINPEESNAK